MSTAHDHARIRYIIRRLAITGEDAKMLVELRKMIQHELGNIIVPFDLSNSNIVTINNTGIKIEYDRNDLNSHRIDINVVEPDSGDPMMTFLSLGSIAGMFFKKLLEKYPEQSPRCFLTFELVDVPVNTTSK